MGWREGEEGGEEREDREVSVGSSSAAKREGRTGVGVHGAAGDEAALDELVRVAAQDLAVLAVARGRAGAASGLASTAGQQVSSHAPGTGLALIGVDDEVARAAVLLPAGLVHERPLEARGEAGAAATAEARVLDLLDDVGVALGDDVLGAVPVAAGLLRGEGGEGRGAKSQSDGLGEWRRPSQWLAVSSGERAGLAQVVDGGVRLGAARRGRRG